MIVRLALLGTLLTLLLPGTAAAAPTWLPSAPISDPGQAAYSAQVAPDGDGGVLVAWIRPTGMSGRVEARFRPPGGAFGPLETVSEGGAEQLQIAVGLDGTAIAVWRRSGRVEAAVRPPGGPFGPPSPISPQGEGVNEPQIAIDGPGNATAAWASTAGDVERIRVATRPPGSAFGEAVEIDSRTDTHGGGNGDDYELELPRIAADPAGRAYLAYRQMEQQYIANNPQTPSYRGRVLVRLPGGSFGSSLVLTPHSSLIDGFAIAAGAGGTAAVAWADSNTDSIGVRVRPPEGPFGPVETPVDLGGGNEPKSPDLAVDAVGNVAVAWQSENLGADDSVGADIRPAGSFFPVAPQTLSETNLDSVLPRVAVDGPGVFHVAWHRTEGIPQLLSSRRAPGGQFEAAVPISPPGQNNLDPRGLQIAGDQEGNAVAVWARNHEGGDRVEVAAHDGAGPRFTSLSIPAAGQLGSPLAFSASAFDTWSAVGPVAWNFGDGDTATGAAASHSFDRPRSFGVSATATDAVGNAITAGGAVAVRDTRRPRIRRLRLSRKRFRVGRRATRRVATAQRRRKRTRAGTLVSYRLSERARVVFAIERARPGRRDPRSRRCVKPTRRQVRRKAKRCTRFVRSGRLRRTSRAGRNRFFFSGRLGRRALRPGRYRLTARATDFARNRSRPARVAFRIARR